jgi:LysM repeat protein
MGIGKTTKTTSGANRPNQLMTKGIVMADTANEGQKLTKGESLTSSNGAYTLTLQDDGNLVLAARGEPRWSTQTNGQNVERAEVQKDGNFVLYTSEKPVWHTNTKGRKGVRLVVQDDGNLVLYAANGAAWSTHTESDAPPPPLSEPEEPVAEEAPDEATGGARTYTVVSGDTLWAISEQFYGDGNKYQEIADASGIPNPDLIQPGQILTIP